MPERCCETCKHWDIDAARTKAGNVRIDKMVSCLWPAQPLPSSMSRLLGVGFTRSRMCATWGRDCPCWEARP